MRPLASLRVFLLVPVLGILAHRACALVTLNDGTDKIFVTGTFSMGYNSNISSSALGVGDVATSESIALEYQRRAGLITVNANTSFSLNDFLHNSGYDTYNPGMTVEFDKGTGRLTGALTLSAQRSSQADAAVNLYTTDWNYDVGLNLHYPVIDRYSFTLSLDYGLIDYTNTGGQPLVNLDTYSSTLGLFYILSEERDFFINYRYRYEESSASTYTLDDGISIGINGKLIGPIHGSLSGGIDRRTPHGVSTDPADAGVVDNGVYNDFWLTGSSSWNFNKRLVFNFAVSRDFATTATNATTDTTSGSIDATFTANARLSFSAGVGGGINQFLGPFGYLPGTTTDRRDEYFTYHASANYTFNSHLSVTLSYSTYRNWSNLAFATFTSHNLNLSLTSRW